VFDYRESAPLLRTLVLLVAASLTACQSAAPAALPSIPGEVPLASPSFATAPTESPAQNTSAPAQVAARTPLPKDIVSAVDSAVDARTPQAAIAATRKILELAGIVVADDANARKGSPSLVYVTTPQLEGMAYEVQRRADLSRVTFREFAATLAGGGALPSLSQQRSPATQASATVKEQPARLAVFVSEWVKLAEKYHNSGDATDLAQSNAPLLLAALAARQEDALDLRDAFLPSDLRLGSLDVAILVSGLRGLLLAGVKDPPALRTAAPARSPSPTPGSTSPTIRPTPSASPSVGPSRSPSSGAVGGRLAKVIPENGMYLNASGGADIATDCAALLEHMNGNVPGLADLYSFAMSEKIKGLVAEGIAHLFKDSGAVEQRLGVLFELLGIVFRIQGLVLLYQNTEVKTELSARQLHKATGAKTPVSAKVVAGIPDELWTKYQQEKKQSPIWSAIRGCGSALGLPLPNDLDDVGGAIKNWRVAWDIVRGSPAHALLPIEQFLGTGRVAGRFERPLELLGDHKATDSITVNVTDEEASDHPGKEIYSPVVVCSSVRTAEPPNLKLLLNAAISGSGAGDIPITGDATKLAQAGEKLLGPAAVASLASTIVDVLAGWLQFSLTFDSCARMTVSHHDPQPGQWTGTVEIRSEYEESLTWAGKDTRDTWQGAERRTLRTGDELSVHGMEQMIGNEVSPFITLEAKQLTYGFNEWVKVETHDGFSLGGCKRTSAESNDYSGTFSYRSDRGGVTLQLSGDGKYSVRFNTDRRPLGDYEIKGTDAQAVQTETRTCVGQNFSRPGTVPAQVIGIGEHPVSGQLDPRNPGSRLTGSETFYDESTGATTTVTWDLMHVGGPIRLPRI